VELTGWTAAAAVITASGVLVLLVTDRRHTGRWSLPVLWTAGLAALTAVAFWFIADGVVWGVAAPGLVIWCATIATGGRPGVLVDPPAPAGAEGASSRKQRREVRMQSKRTWRYLLLLLVVAVAVAALALAGLTGHLPWSS
jgi:hypothetical protein